MSRVGSSVERLVVAPTGDGGVVVSGREPGPAGVATIALLDGAAELVVDVVEHDALVSLRLDAPEDPASVGLALLLLGPVAARRLAGAVGADGTIWDRATDEADAGPFGRSATEGLGTIGRLALALAEVAAADLDDRAVAVGLVEAGVLALELGPDLAPVPSGVELVRAGVGRWDRIGSEAFTDVDPDVLARIIDHDEAWAAMLQPLDPELGDRLTGLVDGLRRHLDVPPVAAAGGARFRLRPAAPEAPLLEVRALPTAAPAAAPKQAFDRTAATAERPAAPTIEVAFSADLDARLIGVEHDGHHLRVHVGGLDEDGPEPWLRVFVAGASGRPTPVALAPLPDHGRPWRTAVALVPPGVGGDRFLVDVTTAPAEPWVAPRDRALARAAHLGAEAARAARRRDPEAQDAWDDCADAWDALDDPDRADAARRFAALGDPTHQGPLLADDLA